MSRNQVSQMVAGGTINPSCFCVRSASADNTVVQAGANASAQFISQIGTKYAPGLGVGSGQAADSGDQIMLFGMGDPCPITVGGSSVTAGDPLKSDSNGNAVTATSVGSDIVIAYADQGGGSGAIILCQLVTPHYLMTSEV